MKVFITLLIALCLVIPASAQYATNVIPDDGSRVMLYQAASGGNGTTTLQFPELISTGSSTTNPNYIGYFLAVIHDAGGSGGAPQVQFREVTGFASTTGILTVTTAFTALAAGDKCYLFQSSILQGMLGTQGLPATPTGAALVAGVSLAEGMKFIEELVDTEVGAIRDSLEDANDLLQAIYGSAATFSKYQFLSATIDLVAADSVWNTVGTNEVFDVTGAMRDAFLIVYDSVAIGGADSIALQIGTTVVSKVLKSEWDANEYMTFPADFTAYRAVDPSTAAGLGVAPANATAGAHILRFHNLQGLDIGYLVGTATPITTGIIRFKLFYLMDPGGSVALGAGGSL